MDSKKVSAKKRLQEYLIITLASLIYGVGTSLLIDPNNLAPGGMTGLSIVMNRVVPLGVGMWFWLMNIPILVIAIWKFGIRFTISTVYATAMISVFTDLCTKFFGQYVIHDMILAVTIGSAMTAVAIGLIFKCHATSGGTDVIIKLLRIRYPHIKTGILYIMTDMVVLVIAAFVFHDLAAAMYSFLSTSVRNRWRCLTARHCSSWNVSAPKKVLGVPV